MKFYEIHCPTHSEDMVGQIIYANNEYEAVGYFILTNYGTEFYIEDLTVFTREKKS